MTNTIVVNDPAELDGKTLGVLRIHQEIHGTHTVDYYAVDATFIRNVDSTKNPVFRIGKGIDEPKLIFIDEMTTFVFEVSVMFNDQGEAESIVLQHSHIEPRGDTIALASFE